MRDHRELSSSRAVPVDYVRAPLSPAPPGSDGEVVSSSISLYSLIRIARQYSLWVALLVVLATSLAAAVLAFIRPTYTSEAILVAQTWPVSLPAEGTAGTTLTSGPTDAEFASILDAIASVSVREKVIADLHLEQDPDYNPAVPCGGKPSPLPLWIQVTIATPYRILHNFLTPSAFQDPHLETLARLSNAVTVQVRGTSRSIAIEAKAHTPEKAAHIANTTAHVFIFQDLSRKVQETSRLDGWLSSRLEELKSQVAEREKQMERLRVDTGRFNGQTASILSEQLSHTSNQLLDARQQLAAAQAKLLQIEPLLASPDGAIRSGDALASLAIQEMRQDEARSSADLAAAESKYGSKNPMLSELRAKVQATRKVIASEATRLAQDARSRVHQLESQVAALEVAQQDLQSRMEDQAASTARLSELQHDAESDRNIYQAFAINRARMMGSPINERPVLTLVSPAVPVPTPSSPKRKMILLGTAICTLSLGLALALVWSSVDQGLRSSEQVSAIFGLETAALIPLARKRGFRSDSLRLAFDSREPRLAESIRHLYATINAVRRSRSQLKVLVSSALPSEGKTATSYMLAQQAALLGAKTLLLRLDLRPSLPSSDLDDREYVTDISQESVSGLSVVSPRTRGPYAFHLLYRKSFWDAMVNTCDGYELVIIDSPPALAVSDVKAILPFVDMTVFLVKWGSTKVASVAEALRQLRSVGYSPDCMVLTQIPPKHMGHSYYTHYYGSGRTVGPSSREADV
jgi:succinoglycan biosynthesis transport protein ExoP